MLKKSKKVLCRIESLLLLIVLSSLNVIAREITTRARVETASLEHDNYSSRKASYGSFSTYRDIPFFVRLHPYSERVEVVDKNGTVQVKALPKPNLSCGGIILDKRRILTTLNCLKEANVTSLSRPNFGEGLPYFKAISRRICDNYRDHPRYGKDLPTNGLYTDIAMVIFDHDIIKDNQQCYQPACIGNSTLAVGSPVIVVGVARSLREKNIPEERPVTTKANIISCRKQPFYYSTMCIRAVGICQADIGAAIVGPDGCTYGLVTRSFDCDIRGFPYEIAAVNLVFARSLINETIKTCTI